MNNKFKEKLELAREMFNTLESKGIGQASEIAKRTFYIQDRLSN